MHRLRFLPLAVALLWGALFSTPAHARQATPATQTDVAGTWDGTYEAPGEVGGDPFSLLLGPPDGSEPIDYRDGTLVMPQGPLAFHGSFVQGKLHFSAKLGDGEAEVELAFQGDRLT